MSMQNERDGSLGSKEEAELRTYRRIASAPQRDGIDELAAAVLEYADPARPASASRERPKEK